MSAAIRTSPSTPSKLRKACNECNAAKVKCSGEASSCSRCAASGLCCIYELSRVGKVPGVRARNKRVRTGPQRRDGEETLAQYNSIHDRMHGHPEHHFFDAPDIDEWSGPLSGPVDHSSLPSANMDNLFDGHFELEDPPPHSRPSLHSTGASSHALSTTEMEIRDPNMEFDFDTGEEDSSVTTNTTNNYSMPNTVPQATPSIEVAQHVPRIEIQSNVDSQCILACCAIVTNLQTYIDAQVTVLNLALDIVRKAVTSLTHIIDQGSHSRCCHMMVAAIMYQIVQILERGGATFLEQKNLSQGNCGRGGLSQFEPVGGILSGFGFSGFHGDLGDQRAWHARIALKEVRQVREILRRVVMLATQNGTVHPIPLETAESCHSDVIQKLDSLVAQFERIQNA